MPEAPPCLPRPRTRLCVSRIAMAMTVYERESLLWFQEPSPGPSLLARFHWVSFGCQVRRGSRLLENISPKARFRSLAYLWAAWMAVITNSCPPTADQ